MSEEPKYVDDPWEEEDTWWNPSDLINTDVLQEALFATGRSKMQFATRKERSQWNKIDKQLQERKITRDWIYHCTEWARKKNAPIWPKVAIKFSVLSQFILNKGAMQDWLGDHPEIAQRTVDDVDEDWGTSFDT